MDNIEQVLKQMVIDMQHRIIRWQQQFGPIDDNFRAFVVDYSNRMAERIRQLGPEEQAIVMEREQKPEVAQLGIDLSTQVLAEMAQQAIARDPKVAQAIIETTPINTHRAINSLPDSMAKDFKEVIIAGIKKLPEHLVPSSHK